MTVRSPAADRYYSVDIQYLEDKRILVIIFFFYLQTFVVSASAKTTKNRQMLLQVMNSRVMNYP